MAKHFDAATKWLLEIDPPAWLACAGLTPTGPVRVIDSDVSTITAEADTIFAVGEPIDYLVHIELQSSRDRSLPLRLLRYNVLLNYGHGVPVRSIAILLRPQADGAELAGLHQVRHPGGDSYLDFRYETVRVWELDLEALLRGGLGTLPLAPLARQSRADPEAVVRRMQERIDREVSKPVAYELWAATDILMGLIYDEDTASRLLRGVRAMRESSTYQAILREGRAEGRAEEKRALMAHQRRMILLHGGRRFGAADAATVAALEAIQDGERLTRIEERLFDAASWDDLLAVD